MRKKTMTVIAVLVLVSFKVILDIFTWTVVFMYFHGVFHGN